MFESVARTEVGSPSHSMSQYSLHLLASFTGAMLCCCTWYQKKKGFRRAPTRSAGAQNIAPTMESVMATSRIVLYIYVVIVMSNTLLLVLYLHYYYCYYYILLLLLILLLLFFGILSILKYSWTGTHWTSTIPPVSCRAWSAATGQPSWPLPKYGQESVSTAGRIVGFILGCRLSDRINLFLNIPVTGSISASHEDHDKPHLLNNSSVIDLRCQCC